jgi:chromosome segregation ATPase
MSAKDHVKKILAALEPFQTTLRAADGSWAEIDAVAGVQSAQKAELVETQSWLERTKAAAQDATARLDALSRDCAKEEARVSARIDSLKTELLDLERQVSEKRTELDAAVAGIAALHRRLTGNAA